MTDNRTWEWPFPGNIHQKRVWKLHSTFVQACVYSVAKLWTSWPINKKILYNGDSFSSLMDNRVKEKRANGCNSRPLITISNHESCLDDPLIWGALLKYKHVLSGQMRWIPTAAELCFTNHLYSFMFSSGRCVPVVRGQGVYQQGVDFCIDRLNERQWVHVFPEGKINFDNSRRLKWGIGRLVAECDCIPDVVPMWLMGMDNILPNKKPYIPRVRKSVAIYVGNPIRLEALVKDIKQQTTDPMVIRKLITDYIEEEFWNLKEKATKHHANYMQYQR